MNNKDKQLFEGFGVKNFRLFKDFAQCSFKNVSIFTGQNNSGKSSLIKALLLLYSSKQHWNKSNLWGERLDFFNGAHGLTSIKTTLNTSSKGIIFSVKNGEYSYCYEFDNKGELYYNYKICKNNQLVIQQAGGDIQLYFSRLIEYFEYKNKSKSQFDGAIKSLIESIKLYVKTNPDFINIFFEESKDWRLIPRISYNPKSIDDKAKNSYFSDYKGSLTDFGIDEADVEQEL